VRSKGGQPQNNDKVRLRVDLTQLNRYVQSENYPLPSTETTFAKLTGAKFFSRLDANSGFWQINVSKDHDHRPPSLHPRKVSKLCEPNTGRLGRC
jgi:hypothetical protein